VSIKLAKNRKQKANKKLKIFVKVEYRIAETWEKLGKKLQKTSKYSYKLISQNSSKLHKKSFQFCSKNNSKFQTLSRKFTKKIQTFYNFFPTFSQTYLTFIQFLKL